MIDKTNIENSRRAIIIGAGPAGITAGYEIIKHTDIQPIVFERSDQIGGLSRTEAIDGHLFDIGPHRFFSKSPQVLNWWNEILPIQAQEKQINPDDSMQAFTNITDLSPDESDNVLLIIKRETRIFYNGKFFSYPVKLDLQTIRGLGFGKTIRAGFRYLAAACIKREEENLEDFFINRFGKDFYQMFFEHYTWKVWGKHPRELAATWGSQRVKRISLSGIFKEILQSNKLARKICNKRQTPERKLIEEYFYFPKFGAGHMWRRASDKIQEMGGKLFTNSDVTRINIEGNRVLSVNIHNNSEPVECDFLFSSMPIPALINALSGIEVPAEVKEIADNLPFRDYITTGILLEKLEITDNSTRKTINNQFTDNWIYIQDKSVRVGRIYFMNNFSPYMVRDKSKILIGAEYFCTEGDDLWKMNETDFIKMTIMELEKIGILKPENVYKAFQIKEKKAYPAYYGSYNELNKVISFLNRIENLYCIGRNGQHRYNNMDHSMLTSVEAVKHMISEEKCDKEQIWSVNADSEYQE